MGLTPGITALELVPRWGSPGASQSVIVDLYVSYGYTSGRFVGRASSRAGDWVGGKVTESFVVRHYSLFASITPHEQVPIRSMAASANTLNEPTMVLLSA